MITRVLAVLFVATVALAAQSQPPTPAPAISSSPGPKQTQPANNHQDETDALRSIASEIRAINQRQADQEKDRANAKPDDWRKGFAPSTWSNWALAFFALVAAGVAVKTLRAIEREVGETAKAAKAAGDSVDALIVMNQPYLDTDVWRGGTHGDTSGPLHFYIWFTVVNRGTTPAKLSAVLVQSSLLQESFTDRQQPWVLLPAGQGHPIHVVIGPVNAEARQAWENEGLTVNVSVTVVFANLFKTRDQLIYRFSRQCRIFDKSGFECSLPPAGAYDEIVFEKA